MKTVALVVGHGPLRDEGAVSQSGKVTEFDWNTELVRMIQQLLVGRVNAHVIFRTVEKISPTSVINSTGADIALEFHLNDSETNAATGTEMIHYPGSLRGQKLAMVMLEAAVDVLELRNRGIKPPWENRGMGFLKKTNMPAVIVESFFIDNDNDLLRGTNMKKELAKAYADAIVQFLQ